MRMRFREAARKACASSNFVASSENSSESVSVQCLREGALRLGSNVVIG